MSELVIDVRGLSKHFANKAAVSDVNLQMPRG